MDRLNELRVFTRIAERNSFTLAAKDLLIPRATVTNLLKRLEKTLNVRLIERTTRKVTLTYEGEIFYERCTRLLSELDEMENLFQQSAPKGILRVNLQGTLAKYFVVPFLNEFLEQYPEITLHVAEDDRQIDLVNDGVDCVLRAGELRDSSLIGKRLATLRQVTVASPEYLKRMGIPQSINGLKHHKAIGYSLDAKSRPTALDFKVDQKIVSIDFATPVIVAGADLYTGAALAGLGIIQVPKYRIAKELATQKLIEIMPANPPPTMPVSALYPSNKHLTSRAKVFLDWLAQQFQAHAKELK